MSRAAVFFVTVLLTFVPTPSCSQIIRNLLARLFCGFAARRVGSLLGDGKDVVCSCSLNFPLAIRFSCQYKESYCIGPQSVVAICGKPKFTGSYGSGVTPSTEVCFAGDTDNLAQFKGTFCLKAYQNSNFITFQPFCNATYDGKNCDVCQTCADVGGYNFRIDCGAEGGPVIPCLGLAPN